MDARSWLRTSSPAKLDAIRELHRHDPRRNAAGLAAFLSLWLVTWALVLSFDSPMLRLPGYLVMGVALHGLGIFMHEAVHGNLFRKRVYDRWAGFLLGAPVLVSATAYRINHLLHHRHTRGPRDPDEFSNHIRNRKCLAAFFYLWSIFGMPIFLVRLPFAACRRASVSDRRVVLMEYGLLIALYAGVAFLGFRIDGGQALVHGWVLPMSVAWLIVNIRGWSEHLLTRPGDSLTETRTITSNVLVSLCLCNLNYHLEHHLFPGVPWYNLPRVHSLLREEYRKTGAPIYSSYLRFLWDAVRTGIHGLAPRVPPEAGATPLQWRRPSR